MSTAQAPGLRLRVAFQGFHHLQATRFPGKVQGGPVGGSAYPTTKKTCLFPNCTPAIIISLQRICSLPKKL